MVAKFYIGIIVHIYPKLVLCLGLRTANSHFIRPGLNFINIEEVEPMNSTCSVVDTQNQLDADASNWLVYEPQSGVDTAQSNFSVNTPSNETKSQLVTFVDQNSAYEYNVWSEPDATFGVADMNDVALGSFFERPLKIATYSWGTNTVLFQKFNPWTLFWENPRVINRVANFNLLRCKLHLKIMINGNGFHYGRALCSYNPLAAEDTFTVDRAFFAQDLIGASQRPHFYLDPTTSQGGEMVLPFFWKKNALSIPEEEWNEMGDCVLQSMQPLKHANGASDQVTISVFAWAEDVSLSGPTSTEPGALTPQSGYEPQSGKEKSDEYGVGIVSRPASMIAKVAGMLEKAPIIGPYCRATSLAAGTTAEIARNFGYSRPAVLEDIAPYKPTYVGNMANTNAPDSVCRLTMDAKQEVTIDPRTTGLSGTDEMAIVPLASRESYVTQFPWAVATPPETLLWNSKVTPAMWDKNPVTTPPEVHMTPSCWVAAPFKYWRGSTKFRFQVVASNYHKGRIKIVYDPYYNTTNEYNVQYTYIVDIAENKDFTLRVGWASTDPYLIMEPPGAFERPYSVDPLPGPFANRSNGVVAVYVVNDLTVPNSTINNDIAVNVFTSMCEDFEVGDPDSDTIAEYSWAPNTVGVQALTEWPLGQVDLIQRKQQAEEDKASALSKDRITANRLETIVEGLSIDEFEPQSGVIADMEDTVEPSAPVAEIADETKAATLSPTDQTATVFLGESITSIRQAMKRYNYHSSSFANNSGYRFLKIRNGNLPYYRGFVPGGVDSATDGVASGPYNRSYMTIMNWYVPAYKGYRGSLRWKYVRAASDEGTASPRTGGTGVDAYVKVKRLSEASTGYSLSTPIYVSTGPNDQSLLRSQLGTNKMHTWDGATMQTFHNPVVEFETPYYSNKRFYNAKEINLTSVAGNQYHEYESLTSLTDGLCEVEHHCATGEDFSLFFFTGAPIIYRVGRAQADPV